MPKFYLDNKCRLHPQPISFFIANVIADILDNKAENWPDIKIESDSDKDLQITQFIKKDEEVYIESKTDRRIFYFLQPEKTYKLVIKSSSYTFRISYKGSNPMNDRCEFYTDMEIDTDAPEKDFIELNDEAYEYYRKNYRHFEEEVDSLKIKVCDEGYWMEESTVRKRPFKTIYLPQKDIDDVIDDVKKFLSPEHKKMCVDELYIPYRRNYLFEGKWGTGKTSFIQAIASECNMYVAILAFNDKIDDVSIIRAVKNIPRKCILVIEDIDCLFRERREGDSHKNRVSFAAILNMLDGFHAPTGGQITIITTNYKNALDPALIRPGRIDKIIHFGDACKEQFEKMFYIYSYMGKSEETEYNDTGKNHFQNFWRAYKELGLEVTTSLLAQFMLKYVKNPKEMIKHVDDLKKLHSVTNKERLNMHM